MNEKQPDEIAPCWPSERDMAECHEEQEKDSCLLEIPVPITPCEVQLSDTGLDYRLSITVGYELEFRLANLRRHPQLQPDAEELEKLAASRGIADVGYLHDWEFRAKLAEAELTALYLDAKKLPARARQATAAKGAQTRLKNNRTHKAKPEALAMWKDWQSGKVLYESGAAFHRAVGEKLGIETTKTVERWCSEWWKARDTLLR